MEVEFNSLARTFNINEGYKDQVSRPVFALDELLQITFFPSHWLQFELKKQLEGKVEKKEPFLIVTFVFLSPRYKEIVVHFSREVFAKFEDKMLAINASRKNLILVKQLFLP